MSDGTIYPISGTKAKVKLPINTELRGYIYASYCTPENKEYFAVSYMSTSFEVKPQPAKVTNFRAENIYTSLKEVNFKFSCGSSSDGHQIEVYDMSKNKKIKTVTQETYGVRNSMFIKHSMFKQNKAFKARCRAYTKINGQKVYGQWSDWEYFVPTLSKTKITNSKVSWSKVTSAKRYVVYAAKSNKTKFKKIATVTKPSMARKDFDKKYKKALKSKVTIKTCVHILPQVKVGNKWITLTRDNSNTTLYYKYK